MRVGVGSVRLRDGRRRVGRLYILSTIILANLRRRINHYTLCFLNLVQRDTLRWIHLHRLWLSDKLRIKHTKTSGKRKGSRGWLREGRDRKRQVQRREDSIPKLHCNFENYLTLKRRRKIA